MRPSLKIALPILCLSLLAAGCQPKENGKTTRLRPDMRRKLNQPTLDTAGGAVPGRGSQGQGADGNPLDIPTERCHLTSAASDRAQTGAQTDAAATSACDTILVQSEADGKIILNSLKNLENLDDGLDISADQIKRYKTDASGQQVMDPSGEFFTVQYKSVKGAQIVDGRDVLRLTYILPLKLNQLDWQSLIVTINGQDVRLSQDDQSADVLVSEWSQKVIVRITNINLIENINFEINIRGKLKVDALDGAQGDGAGSAGAEAEATNANAATGTTPDVESSSADSTTPAPDASSSTGSKTEAGGTTTTTSSADATSGVQVTVTPSN